MCAAEPLRAAAWQQHVRWVRIGGRATRILDAGSGPLVVCVSGVASTLVDWLLLVEQLSTDHRVIVYDRPGYAPSDHLRARRTDLIEEARRALAVAAWAADTQPPEGLQHPEAPHAPESPQPPEALQDSQTLQEPGSVTLVGHSMGAYVCEAAARLDHSAMTAIVLLDGSTLSEADEPQHDPNRRSRLLAPVIRSQTITAAWHLFGSFAMWVGVRGRAEIWRRFPDSRREFRAHSVLAATVRELLDFDSLAAALAALRRTHRIASELRIGVHPAASFWPSRQPRLRERLRTWGQGLWDEAQWIASVLAEAQYLSTETTVDFDVVAPAGHFVMIDQPQAVAARVRRATSAGWEQTPRARC